MLAARLASQLPTAVLCRRLPLPKMDDDEEELFAVLEAAAPRRSGGDLGWCKRLQTIVNSRLQTVNEQFF